MVAKKDEATVPQEKSGFSLSAFLEETKEELSKVVWPSRQQLISESVAVVFTVILAALLIYLVDNFFSWAATQIFLPGITKP